MAGVVSSRRPGPDHGSDRFSPHPSCPAAPAQKKAPAAGMAHIVPVLILFPLQPDHGPSAQVQPPPLPARTDLPADRIPGAPVARPPATGPASRRTTGSNGPYTTPWPPSRPAARAAPAPASGYNGRGRAGRGRSTACTSWWYAGRGDGGGR